MRWIALFSPLVLLACAPQDVGSFSNVARFTAFPAPLFEAFESVCVRPEDTFVRKTRTRIQCRTFMSPEATAAVILQYEGVTSDLPQYVIELSSTARNPGYDARMDTFLDIPQKSGPMLRVPFEDRAAWPQLQRLYARLGGVAIE